jgi:hypothetical protein
METEDFYRKYFIFTVKSDFSVISTGKEWGLGIVWGTFGKSFFRNFPLGLMGFVGAGGIQIWVETVHWG